jgi:N-methylhydantoinase B
MTRINDYLTIVGSGRDAGIQCRCGHRIGPASENYKSHVLLHEGPVQNAGPFVDPNRVGGDRFVCREFFCPACVTLLDVEIAQRGEPFVWDVRLEVNEP